MAAKKKKIPKPELKSISFYDWHDIEAAVEAKTGRSLNNWAGKTYGTGPKSHLPYQDFWHQLLDYVEMNRGAVEYIDFEDMREFYQGMDEEEWVGEIIDTIQDVMGKDELPIRFDW
jgi:hypothetical protein